jgi:hypothetical protein
LPLKFTRPCGHGPKSKRQHALDKRLDFFLESPDQSKAEAFRETYVKESEIITKRISDLEIARGKIASNKTELLPDSSDLKSIMDKVFQIQKLIEKENRPVLKNLYRALFRKISVSKKNHEGKIEINFELKSNSSMSCQFDYRDCDSDGKKSGDRVKMGSY